MKEDHPKVTFGKTGILIINLDDTNPKSLLNSLFGDYSYHQKKLYQFGVSLVPYEQVCKIYIN